MTALPQPMHEAEVLREHQDGAARVLAEAHADLSDVSADTPFHEMVGTLRQLDRCPACDKTRAVINIAGQARRGFHHPFKAERVSPQTHCSCAGGPVPRVDEWSVVFLRTASTGTGRVFLLDHVGAMEPLQQKIVRHSPDGFEWGYFGSGAADLALNVLRLVTSERTADTYYHAYKSEVVAQLPRDAHKVTFTLREVREWLARRTARIDLDQFVREILDGVVGDDGPFANGLEAAATAVRCCEAKLRGPLPLTDRTRLEMAMVCEWNRRAADATGVSS